MNSFFYYNISYYRTLQPYIIWRERNLEFPHLVCMKIYEDVYLNCSFDIKTRLYQPHPLYLLRTIAVTRMMKLHMYLSMANRINNSSVIIGIL